MMKPDDALFRAICCHCGKPVLTGQPRWAGDPQDRAWHYACAEQARLVIPHRTWTRRPAH